MNVSVNRLVRIAAALAVVAAPATAPLAAQTGPDFFVEWADGTRDTVPLTVEGGYATLDIAFFESLGWAVVEVDQAVALAGPDDVLVVLRVGSPYFLWGDEALQLVEAPIRSAGRTRVPVQLLSDFLPRRLPELYAFDGALFTLRAASPDDWAGDGVTPPELLTSSASNAATVPAPDTPLADEEADPAAAGMAGADEGQPDVDDERSTYDGTRVVIIDAGHGGGDPGTLGIGGLREKDIALSISLIIADLLSREPGIEVHMTREDDTFVPIWDRGQIATDIKGDRPGVFLSVHANSFPDRRAARGFETYFLSEARNDHERRVSAIENAPLSVEGDVVDPEEEPDLGFILRELRTLDHQHWSAMLAEMTQDEMARVHPGPNRGVKQGVLAVLTNAVMPSVLVEVGYLSNPDEAPLMNDPDFHDQAARAIARSVLRFFERYPPGAGTGSSGPGA